MLSYKIHSKLGEGTTMVDVVEDGAVVSSTIVQGAKGCVCGELGLSDEDGQAFKKESAFFCALKKHRYVGYGIALGLLAYAGVGEVMADDTALKVVEKRIDSSFKEIIETVFGGNKGKAYGLGAVLGTAWYNGSKNGWGRALLPAGVVAALSLAFGQIIEWLG